MSHCRKRIYLSKSTFYAKRKKNQQLARQSENAGQSENYPQDYAEISTNSAIELSQTSDLQVNRGEVVINNSESECDEHDFQCQSITNQQQPVEGHNLYETFGGKKRSLAHHLASWAIIPGQIKSNVTALLKIIRIFHPNLPGDFRALLKTPRKISGIVEVAGGRYYHFGLEEELKKSILKLRKCYAEILVDIGIDGSPLFPKSGSTELWPIFGCISGEQDVFVIGLYHGKTKPNDPNSFLRPFVNDLQRIQETGVLDTGCLLLFSK